MDFKTRLDSVSYALGYIEANQIKKQLEQQTPFALDSVNFVEMAKAFSNAELQKRYVDFRKNQFDTISFDAFQKGFLNQFAYNKSYFTETTADMLLRKVFEEKRAAKDEANKKVATENLEKGKKFLEENKKKAEVKVTDSGLQYEILRAGKGEKPQASSQIKCQYHGTLLNGKVFDSSVERGDTASFRVNGVIKGWTEALQLMPVGSKWRLYVPSELAYGEKGAGNDIGPNEVLIFDVDLIEVVK
ncbi:FKBP-type peptidyl-prolyl cis-trans isomerase [Marinilabiliaceae bacterium JC017]|nr:FKBP-type peptidyl-prolyl cis-trans isomerase [Marinilabiliaceae bacterium JC017]